MSADLQAITIERRDGGHAGHAAESAIVMALGSGARVAGVEWLR
ncbi:hypothetical protein JOF29_001760 [Kribbella aluminosa]|uniref:Uncharacterized protein n=1 Tax=Kribbella aluminosa TaxID=416017 RepID=A0ABS4UGA9_9ACTN|nr:hypothetical protein [Kribbella aluminosa]